MGGKTATISNSEQRLLSLQVQQSSQGLTLPVVYGRTRIAGNLIWYGDFAALEHKTVTRSGKGGGGVKQVDIKYDYEAAVALALCEGEIQGVTAVWRDKEKFTRLADLGLTLQNGSHNQPVWGHLQTKHPDQALSYSDTAYVYGATYRLTKSAQIHSHNFEVAGKLAYSEHIPDANPRDVLVDLLTNPNYGCGFPAENLADTDVYSTYCRALGLFVSPAYAEQNEAQQVLSELLEQTHSAAVFSEGRLKIIPYGDAPASGNGAVYVPNLTPIYDLTDDDYIVSGADDPVRCERKAAADAYNQVQIEYLDRSNDYNIAVAEAKDQANIEKYGLRPKDAVKMHAVCDKAVAQRIAQLLLQRGLYVRNEYEFKLGWKYVLLEPMDLVTLTDAGLGLDKTPVRIIEIDEDADGMLTVRAEDFPFGAASATTYPTQGNDGYAADYNVAPQNTYAPAIFEAPLQLTNGEPQIWLAASGGEHWGGCEVWVSGDGDSYVRAGSIHQKARYGSLTAPLPAGAVYDNANRAEVQLLSGSLQGVSENDARDMLSACLVGNEFLAFADAELTGVGQYRLSKLVRGAWGSAPESHAAGTRFVRVDDTLFRYPFSPEQMGKTVYIKLISFNIFGAALQDLSEVPAYPYTIVGAPLGQVSNLRLTSEWAWGKQCALAWDKLDGADSYDVEVYAATSQTRLRLINGVVDNRYTYTLADMKADGGQVRDVVFKVRGRAVTGKTGKWTQLVARNPQLKALQGIELESGLKQAFFKCATPQEDDFAGLLLWVSEQADCPAVPENLAYDGADTFVVISKCKGQPLQGGKTYYVRAAGYDSFDKQQLNISSSHAFTVYEVNAIAKELSESNLAGSLKERIGKIDGNGAGSVNARIAEEAEARAAAVRQESQARTVAIRAEADKQTAALRAESGKLNTAIASAAQTARQELTAQVAKLTAKDGELQRAQAALDGKAAELTRTAQQLGNRITAAETVNREQATAIQTVTAAHGRTAAALETEKTARAQGDAAEARAREALAATVGQHTAALAAERQARIDGDAANTRELNTAKSRLENAEAALQTEARTRAEADRAEAAARQTLAGTVGQNTAAIAAVREAKADKNQVAVLARQTLAAEWQRDAQNKADAVKRVADAAQGTAQKAAADLLREQQTRAAGDEANAREITAAKARLGTAESGINELRQTTARQNQALAEAQNSLTARIGGLQVGGRNYVRNSNFARQLTDWDNWGNAARSIISAHGRQWLRLTASGAGRYRGVSQIIGYFEPNTPYTVSFDAYAVSGGAVVGIHQIGANLYPQIWRDFALTATPQRISFGFVSANDAAKSGFRLMLGGSDNGFDICIANIKFEQGNLATDWSPAPEDGDAATAAVAAELTAYKKAQANTDAAQTAELQAAKSQIGQQTAALEQIRSTKADKSEVSAQLQTTLQSAARDAQAKADAAQSAAERTAQIKAEAARQAAERASAADAQSKVAAAQAATAAEIRAAKEAAAADAQRKADAARTAAASAAETADRAVLQQAAEAAQAKADAAKRAAETAASADATAKANAAKAQAKADAAADASSKADAAKNAAIAEAQRLNIAANARINELQNTIANNREAAATQISSLTAKLGADTNLINPATTQAGHYISESNGSVLDWSTHVLTDFVAVSAGQTYTFTSASPANNLRWAWYNAQRGFVSGRLVGGDNYQQTLVAPVGAAFVRLSAGTNRNTRAFALRLDPTAAELASKADAAKHTELDLTALDADTWYPVTFGLRTTEITVLRVAQGLQSGKHNPPWATHGSRSFSLLCEWEANGHGWGTVTVQRTVRQFEYGWTRDGQSPLLNIGQLGSSSNEYCLLRGGAKYDVYTPPYITPVLRTEAYTAHSQTVSPLTAYNAALVPKATLKQALADITAEREARAEADRAQTAEITAAKSQIGNNTAAIDRISSTKADKTEVAALARTSLASEWRGYTDAAKAAALNEVNRLNTATNARVNTLEQTVSTQNSATATQLRNLSAAIDRDRAAASSSVSNERTARVNADNALTQQLNTAKSQIGTANSQITALQGTVAANHRAQTEQVNTLSAKLDNLQIGGRNYVLASDRSTSGSLNFSVSGDLLPETLRGQTLTVSCDIVCTGIRAGSKNRIGAEIRVEYTDGTSAYIGAWRNNAHTAGNFRGRITGSLKLADKPVRQIHALGIYNQTGGGTATVARPKLEIGSVATDWSPAPEDVATSAQIQTVQNALAEKDRAHAQQIQTVQTTLNGVQSSVQTAAASVNGLKAQYTVKVDANGHVAGYGLASEPVNGRPRSKFIVQADQFGIGATGKSTAYPFVVDTRSNTVGVNGALVVNGKAIVDKLNAGDINGAKIAANSITANHLQARSISGDKLAVTTLSAISSNLGTVTAGSLNIGNGNCVITGQGVLTARNANISGHINASSGVFRGRIEASDGYFNGTVKAERIEGDVLKGLKMKKEGRHTLKATLPAAPFARLAVLMPMQVSIKAEEPDIVLIVKLDKRELKRIYCGAGYRTDVSEITNSHGQRQVVSHIVREAAARMVNDVIELPAGASGTLWIVARKLHIGRPNEPEKDSELTQTPDLLAATTAFWFLTKI